MVLLQALNLFSEVIGMSEIITKVLPGFMELLPEEQIEFDRIKNIITTTYEQYGFTAIDTPVIERSKTLLAKAGGETEKQIYCVENRNGAGAGNSDEYGKAELSLRFDLTVPLARYVAEHFNELSFPFRRCHISKVYRGERPQKGRFREFYQCDIDVIGKDKLSIRYDAEIPSIIYQLFKQLDFGKFTIRINNRKILNGLIGSLNIDTDKVEILRIIDKAEKISRDELILQFKNQGITDEAVEKLLGFINIKGSTDEVISMLKSLGVNNGLFNEGLEELATVTTMMAEMGVETDYFKIDLSIARGLDYYTGTVYETVLDDYPKIGSVCSGGRYDNLASYYTTEKLPGVGISIGLTRLFYQLREVGLITCTRKTVADIVVVPMDDLNIKTAFRIANCLRTTGYNVDVLLEELNIKKKFLYVKKKEAFFTIVIGSEEEASGQLTVQYKANGELKKELVSIDSISEFIKSHYYEMRN